MDSLHAVHFDYELTLRVSSGGIVSAISPVTLQSRERKSNMAAAANALWTPISHHPSGVI
jgi:hypothetical protein